MANYLLALWFASMLMLSGCAAFGDSGANNSAGSGQNGGSNSFSNALGPKGKALVTLMDVSASCASSGCAAQSALPHAGKVMVWATDLAEINLANTNAWELQSKTVQIGLLEANSQGELLLELPEGSYMLTFAVGSQSVMDGPITIEAGQTAMMGANFTK